VIEIKDLPEFRINIAGNEQLYQNRRFNWFVDSRLILFVLNFIFYLFLLFLLWPILN